MVKVEKSLASMNHSLKSLPWSKILTKHNLIISTIRRLEGWLIMICKVGKLNKEVSTKRIFNLIDKDKAKYNFVGLQVRNVILMMTVIMYW